MLPIDVFHFLLGSGRVTFDNHKSFMMAVRSGFIEIETPKFTKKVNNDDMEENLDHCLCKALLPTLLDAEKEICYK